MKNKPAPLLNPGTLKPMTARELDGHSANSKPAALQGNRAAGCFYRNFQK